MKFGIFTSVKKYTKKRDARAELFAYLNLLLFCRSHCRRRRRRRRRRRC